MSVSKAAQRLAEMRDETLCARDERVRTILREEFNGYQQAAKRLREEAHDMENCARQTKQAIERGEWWKFEGLLSNDDIESLCECEPVDRLDAFLY